MKLIHRPASERGQFENDWLKARYSFSFSSYQDPQWVNFGQMRVLNHDVVQPARGFAPHSHQDMEIITYVIQGAVEHQDSMGNREIIRAGEVQVMSAGSGVQHSEVNPSSTELLELFQIWVFPAEKGIRPRYEQMAFPPQERVGRLEPMVSPMGQGGPLSVQQNFYLQGGVLEVGQEVQHRPQTQHVWLQVARGHIEVEGQKLGPGDGLGLDFSDQPEADGPASASSATSPLRLEPFRIKALQAAEFIVLES